MPVETIAELVAWQPESIQSIISDGLLPKGGKLIFFGPMKSWKSMLAMNLSSSIALGESFMGFDCAQQSVMLLQLEIGRAQYRERIIKYLAGRGLAPDDLSGVKIWSTYHLKLDRDHGRNVLERELVAHMPDVLIIDPVYKILTGRVTDSYDVSRLLDNMDLMIDRYGISLVLIHHSRQAILDSSGKVVDRGIEELMGSTYFGNWADSIISTRVEEEGEQYDWVRMKFEALRHAVAPIAEMMLMCDRDTLQIRPELGG